MTSASNPDQIRHEIERTQAGLSRDVDLLTEKVTPSKIVERRVSRARDTAGRWKNAVMGSDTSAATHRSPYPGPDHAGAVSGAASTFSDAATATADAVQDVPRVARRRTQGNPLAAGLIAFGAGWLVSSLIPASEREQELAEEARQQAAELAQPLAEQAQQAATEVKDTLAPRAQEAMESVKSAASAAGETVAAEGRAAADHVQDKATDAGGTVRQNAAD